jgi:hypothetical protein
VDLEDLQRELFLPISAWTNAEEEVIIFIFSYKRTRVNVKKKIESRRQVAEAMQQSTAILENESEHTTFEGIFSVDKAFYIRKDLFIELYFTIC